MIGDRRRLAANRPGPPDPPIPRASRPPPHQEQAPLSNAERQRRFRKRNPGYFKKYRAAEKAARRRLKLERQAYAHRLQAELLATHFPLFAPVILAAFPEALATFWCTKPSAPAPAPEVRARESASALPASTGPQLSLFASTCHESLRRLAA